MPTFKWRHTAWVEELKIPALTKTRTLKVSAEGVTVVSGKDGERVIFADTVIAAVMCRSNQELFHELEWLVDELHGCGDAMVPRGLTQAIHDGYRLGVRI